MNKKRILFVTQFFPPRSSPRQTGGLISNRSMLKSLSDSYQVYVLSFDRACSGREFSSEPYTVIHRPAPVLNAYGIFREWNRLVNAEVRLALEEIGEVELILATTSTLGALSSVRGSIQTAAVVRAYENFGFGCEFVPLRTRYRLFKQALLRRFSDARELKGSDFVITNSEFMRSAISKRFNIEKEKIEVLLQQCGGEITSCNLKDNSVGFVNRGAEKNSDFVIKLAERSPELNFHIYGHTEALPEDLPHNVIVKGWESDREKMFSSVSLWIVPSCWAEPFGRVSIEAQAAQRPVLVADNGGLPETVLDSRFKIEGFNVSEWRDRIHELLAIGESELAKNALRIQKIYSKEAHDKRILEVFERITNGA